MKARICWPIDPGDVWCMTSPSCGRITNDVRNVALLAPTVTYCFAWVACCEQYQRLALRDRMGVNKCAIRLRVVPVQQTQNTGTYSTSSHRHTC